MSEKTIEHFVGIDVAKAQFDLCIAPSRQRLEIAHDEAGIESIVERLRALAPSLIVMEATGGMETALAAALAAAGLPVAVVNPRQVRDYARATGQLAKTDRLDAAVLADFARAVRPAVRPIKDAETRELEALLTRRRQLVGMRTEERLRLASAASASKMQQKSLTEHIAWLDQRIAALDDELKGRLRRSEVWRERDDLLRAIPGVGPVTRLTLFAGCPELGRLNRREIAKLAGVAPLANDSGSQRGRRSIWGGRASLRATVYMATLAAMRANPVIRTFAERLRAAAKPPKVVIIACARKLLTIINAMIKHNTPWNPKIA